MKWNARTDLAAAGIPKSTSASGLRAHFSAWKWADPASRRTLPIATVESALELTFAHRYPLSSILELKVTPFYLRINDAALIAIQISAKKKKNSGKLMTENAF